MFEKGSLLVHPTYGVCEVVHIGTLDMKNVKDNTLYYTMVPVYDSKSQLFIPTESGTNSLRPVMSKERAMELVKEIPAMEPVTVPSEKEREKIFKELLRNGKCEDAIRIIKTLYLRKQARLSAGKKTVSLDEKYLFMAREQIYGELAVALGIKKDEVEAYIREYIEKNQSAES